MNSHARWRLDLARDLCAGVQRFAGIQAIVVGGSVARGYSEAYSDLELMLFWDRAPGAEVRDDIRARLRAEFRYPEMDIGHESALLISGVPVDLWHVTIAHEEATLVAVLHEHSLDLVANNVLETIRTCIPLYGEDLVRQWKDRVEEYPEELAAGFLQTYLPHFHLRQLNLAARRDNPTAFYAMLSAIQCHLFLCLLALNKSYFPTYKWMYQTLARLAIKPAHTERRLRQMFAESQLSAATQLHSVLTETLAIAEARYPQVDTAFARYGLDQLPRTYGPPT